MSIMVEFEGTIAKIILSGSIDYSTQDELKLGNDQVLTAEHIKEIQVNLADVTFLDSSGIRELLLLQKKASAGGKSLVLLNCGHPIREIFEIAGFDKMFTIR